MALYLEQNEEKIEKAFSLNNDVEDEAIESDKNKGEYKEFILLFTRLLCKL